MSERSPHTRYYSDELDDLMDDWAENSNLSKADIIDAALGDFFDSRELTEDGRVVPKDEIGTSGSDVCGMLEDVLDNQDEIKAAVSSDDDSPSRGNSEKEKDAEEPKKSGGSDTSEVKERLLDLKGDYGHDVAIDPLEISEVDFKDSDDLTYTPRHLLPAFVAALNHEREDGRRSLTVDELGRLADRSVGTSEKWVRGKMDNLVDSSVVYASVTAADALPPSSEMPEALHSKDRTGCDDLMEIPAKRRRKYDRSAKEVIKRVAGSDSVPEKQYYFDREDWWSDTYEFLNKLAAGVDDLDADKGASDRSSLQEYEWSRGAARIGVDVSVWVSRIVDADVENELVKAFGDAREDRGNYSGTFEIVDEKIGEGN